MKIQTGLDDQAWSASVAELVADALIDAKFITSNDLEAVRAIISQEVAVRLSMGNRPKATIPN